MLQLMTPVGTDMTDADTVEQYLEAARLGDERAFERLYRETVGAVYGLCLRLTANPPLAEECVQQVYVQAWRNLHRFRGDSALTTWLHRIAINEVRSQFRREKKHAADPLHPIDDPAISDDAGTVDLERAITALPDRARAVFVLVGIYGYPHEEAASMLGIATGTSKAHYHHARKQLRRHLEATP
jgi:RNA polymerase sigma-70 factor (ECF subfamily)